MTLNTVHRDIATMLLGDATIWCGDVAPIGFSMHIVLLTLTLLNSDEVLGGHSS